jgi:hypothetical protein
MAMSLSQLSETSLLDRSDAMLVSQRANARTKSKLKRLLTN